MAETRRVCPEHGIPDCSPLLNGCSRVIRMHSAQPHLSIWHSGSAPCECSAGRDHRAEETLIDFGEQADS